MENGDDVNRVARLIARYVESPSRSHIRHPKSIDALSNEIVREISDRNPMRQKWSAHREALALKAAPCWIPPEDLRAALNALPGPPLTNTDLEQRLKDFVRDSMIGQPNPDLKDQCREMYEAEKGQGTEFAAIVSAIADWETNQFTEAMQREFAENERKRAEARKAKEEVLFSGADCGWTTIGGSKTKWCRIDGRTFRATQNDQPAPGKGGKKMVLLHRVKSTEPDEPGVLIGTYETSTLAAEIARQLIASRDARIK
jgi:hypothetical protein